MLDFNWKKIFLTGECFTNEILMYQIIFFVIEIQHVDTEHLLTSLLNSEVTYIFPSYTQNACLKLNKSTYVAS